MSNSAPLPSDHCHVVGGEKMAAALGGSERICAEVDRAIASEAPHIDYTAEITIMSASRLRAKLIVEGQTLPIQNFAVMDGNLTETMVKRFANSLASVVAQAAKR